MKFDTTIAPLTPAKYFAGTDKTGKFFVVKKTQKGNVKPVAPCATGKAAVMAAEALSLMEKMAVTMTLQVIAKARAT